MASYDFIIDIDQLNDLSKELDTKSDEIKGIIDEIYTIIKYELSDAWSGESYNIFKEKCMQYKPALEGLVFVMKAYAKLIDPYDNILSIDQCYTNITNTINGENSTSSNLEEEEKITVVQVENYIYHPPQ